MNKYKISAVSYLNTKPFMFGLFQSEISKQLDIHLDIPSICAEKMINGTADIGLVPVAALPKIKNYNIISNYCIGTQNIVKTVALFSNKPIENINEIHLDFHSRTSVLLLKILMKEFWKKDIIYHPTDIDFDFHPNKSCLIIGDRAIEKSKDYRYSYDLGEYWFKHTGLPFVFAVWITNTTLSEDFIVEFNKALKLGLDNVEKLASELQYNSPNFDLVKYYKEYISYQFDANKKEALDLYLSKIENI